ncbi:MAG: AMP-binding protein, partial [Gemmatimonadota bacterium]|nr:AMP-binding protein [Gemmatimonadota bacterium]
MSTDISDRPGRCRSIDELLDRHARERPATVSMQVDDVSVTYGELLERVEQLAAHLVEEGLEAGDRIALLCKNDFAFCELMMAASRTGIVLVPLNYRLALPEIEFIVQDSGARILFAGTDFVDSARAAQATSGTCASVVEVTADGLFGGWAPSSAAHSAAVRDRDAILFQMYTSGTTGKPKGALISQKNVLAMMANGCRELGPFHEASRSLVCMPLFHVAGSAWLFFGIAAGCTNDLVVDIDPGRILDRIEQNEISCTLMVPTVIHMVTTEAEARGATVSGLKTICFGASPMPAELLKRAKRVFPDTDFIHVYGMTETTCMFTALDPAELRADRRLESCGKPFADAEVKVVDPEGVEVPAGVVGEIICRTPQLMTGYWNRPEATSNAIRDGWYHTGDAGQLDEEGFLYIRDRIKDLVITGGENVYPAEVENAVLAHPGVADVAVIGVPDEKWGEIVLAAIVVGEGAEVED